MRTGDVQDGVSCKSASSLLLLSTACCSCHPMLVKRGPQRPQVPRQIRFCSALETDVRVPGWRYNGFFFFSLCRDVPPRHTHVPALAIDGDSRSDGRGNRTRRSGLNISESEKKKRKKLHGQQSGKATKSVGHVPATLVFFFFLSLSFPEGPSSPYTISSTPLETFRALSPRTTHTQQSRALRFHNNAKTGQKPLFHAPSSTHSHTHLSDSRS